MPGVMQAKMEIGTPILGKEGLCAQIQVKSSNHSLIEVPITLKM